MPKIVDPVRIERSDEKPEREPLFYLDDVEYTIPVEVPAALVVRIMQDLADGQDPLTVGARAVEDIIGRDALDALRESPDVRPEHLRAIMEIVEAKLGTAQDMIAGKSRPAPRR